jgi:hypothetical protein
MNTQQRAKHAQAAEAGDRRDSAQPLESAAAEQAMENSFRLVVGVVREEDAAEIVPGDDLLEEFPAKGAEAGGEIRRGIGDEGLDLLSKSDGGGQIPTRGQLGDEAGVGGALLAAGLVIQMNDVQLQIGPGSQ